LVWKTVRSELVAVQADDQSFLILVVDDDAPLRMVTADLLVDAGYRVIEALDAQEALALLESGSDVRVVLTDWVMPGEIDGLGLGSIISERWAGVGTLVTSGKIYPDDLPDGVRFLAKPYKPIELIEEVRALIQGQT